MPKREITKWRFKPKAFWKIQILCMRNQQGGAPSVWKNCQNQSVQRKIRGLRSCSLPSANYLVSNVKFESTWLLKWTAELLILVTLHQTMGWSGDSPQGSLFSTENEIDPGICLSLYKERQSRVSGLGVVFQMCQIYKRAHHGVCCRGKDSRRGERKKPCISQHKNIGWTYEEHSPSADDLERQWRLRYSFEKVGAGRAWSRLFLQRR